MRIPLALVCFVSVGLTVGCGSTNPETIAVTGRVTCQGKPVAGLLVQFTPQGEGLPGKPAGGTTDADGKFSLSTYKDDDGAVVGLHQVAVMPNTPEVRWSCKSPENLTYEVKPGCEPLQIEL